MAKSRRTDREPIDPEWEQQERERLIADTHLPPHPNMPTAFDLCDFPTPLDETDRRNPEWVDLIYNLRMLEHNARHWETIADQLPAAVVREAKMTLLLLSVLQEATENKDGYTAVEVAFHLGRLQERLYNRAMYDNRIQAGRRAWANAGKSREKKDAKTDAKHAEIRRRFQERVAKRGKRKQPTNTTIRHRIADEMTAEETWGNVSYRIVMDETKAPSKK